VIFARFLTPSAALRALAASAAVFCASALPQPGSVDLGAAPSPAAAAPASPAPSAQAASASSIAWPAKASSVASAASAAARRAADRSADHHQAKPAKHDDLDADLSLAIKDAPEHAVDLPGVLKLDGAAIGVLDPTRARKISWTNEGSQTVYVSATDPNRFQFPFPNPRVIGTTDVDIDKRPNSSNVYVTFVAGVTHPVQVWFEPHEGSGASVGLLLVPKRIPGQSIQIVDDTGALTPHATRAEEPDDFLARVQSELQDALEGRSPPGWSAVNVPVPPIVLDGVLVDGVRRLSSLSEDIYVYTVRNPSPVDVVLDESQFDGPRVEAVSILPSPLLHSRGTTYVAVLARKGAVVADASAGQVAVEGH